MNWISVIGDVWKGNRKERWIKSKSAGLCVFGGGGDYTVWFCRDEQKFCIVDIVIESMRLQIFTNDQLTVGNLH